MKNNLPRRSMLEWFVHHRLVDQHHDFSFTHAATDRPHFLKIKSLKLLDFFVFPPKRIVQHTCVALSSSIGPVGVVGVDDALPKLPPVLTSVGNRIFRHET